MILKDVSEESVIWLQLSWEKVNLFYNLSIAVVANISENILEILKQ